MIMKVIFVLLVCVYVYPFILCFIDKKYGTSYSCKQWGWHNGSGNVTGFDGCSIHATCGKCGKKVMQDSQGNWF